MLSNAAVAATVEAKAARQLAKVELSLEQTLERQRHLAYLRIPELFGRCNDWPQTAHRCPLAPVRSVSGA
jgi:hypothetical protein